ncbi:hypothetical protein YC2023_028884 [Brassica napus]
MVLECRLHLRTPARTTEVAHVFITEAAPVLQDVLEDYHTFHSVSRESLTLVDVLVKQARMACKNYSGFQLKLIQKDLQNTQNNRRSVISLEQSSP